MDRTRFFGQLVDPRPYRRGYGFLGTLIVVLNEIRVWLEKLVALLILRAECRKLKISEKDTNSILQQAKTDPYFQPRLHRVEMPGIVRKLVRDKFEAVNKNAEDKARNRYGKGRANSDTPERPIPIADGMRVTLAGFERRNDRSLRYLQNRAGRQIVFDDDMERVEGGPDYERKRTSPQRNDP